MLLFVGLGEPSNDFIWITGIAALLALPLALVGVLLAVVPILQMLFGKPDVHIRFGVNVIDGVEGKGMRVYITHGLVRSRLLKRLGVTRKEAYIEGAFSIYRMGTNEPMVEQARMFSAMGQAHSTVLLKPSFMPEIVTVMVQSQGQTTIEGPDGNGKSLPPGAYRIEVEVWASEDRFVEKRRFWVGTTPSETYWEAVVGESG